MDAFLCGVQNALAKIKALRFCPLSVRLGMARSCAITIEPVKRGTDVAKIIEFYIPNNFRKREKWIPPQNRGKVIEFTVQTTKTA